MKFFRKILVSGIAATSMLLCVVNVFAENHIMKIAFVGDPELTDAVVRKAFVKVRVCDERNTYSDVYGIRVVTPSDTVLYKFKNPLISDRFDRVVSPECSVIFMIADFSPGKSNVDDVLTQDLFNVRRISGGRKIVLIAVNNDHSYEIDLQKLDAARSLYGGDNFDYILSPSTQDDEAFRSSFFEVTDKVINWKMLPVPVGDDLAFLHKSDPAGAMVSKFFDDMIGLDKFKDQLKGIVVRITQDKRDADRGKSGKTKPSYHMILKGNPGTGKTTIARRMADVLHDAGIIPTNKFVQVERKDLVGQYIGHTEAKVKEILESAAGGVIFIDEAYSLSGAGGNDFGKHVIEGLLTAMTDDRCIIITAGYPDKMQEFLDSNPGLTSRFKYYVDIPDYSEQDLFVIFKSLVSKNGFAMQPTEEQRIQDLFVRYFQEQKTRLKENFGNARSVETFFESVKDKRALRLNSRRPGVLEDFITLEDVMHVIHGN